MLFDWFNENDVQFRDIDEPKRETTLFIINCRSEEISTLNGCIFSPRAFEREGKQAIVFQRELMKDTSAICYPIIAFVYVPAFVSKVSVMFWVTAPAVS